MTQQKIRNAVFRFHVEIWSDEKHQELSLGCSEKPVSAENEKLCPWAIHTNPTQRKQENVSLGLSLKPGQQKIRNYVFRFLI